MRVLVIGSGGREHCLAWKISQSQIVNKVFCAPGNAGTASIAENVPIKANDIPALADFAFRQKIDLTVVGPEQPLAMGITNVFEEKGLRVFGPSKAAAEIESSKAFCRKLLKEANVPQPNFKVLETAEEAIAFVQAKGAPIVVKADGLAGGKGVFVTETQEEAINAINKVMVEKAFGNAGEKIVLEERLFGQEVSFVCFVDGKNALPLASSQDHKRALDNDEGANTGGMGAYSPTPFIDFEMENKVLKEIIEPTISALKAQNREFKGILYAGLMISEGKPKLLEFNCRFGDPETQAVLPRLQIDIMKPITACLHGELDKIELKWKDIAACCIVLASSGYPGKFETGKIVSGIEIARGQPNTIVFHSGTKFLNGRIVSNSGRVLNVVGLGKSLQESIATAYSSIKKIYFDNMFYRKDIGAKALR